MKPRLLPEDRILFRDDPDHYVRTSALLCAVLLLGISLIGIGTVLSLIGGSLLLLAFPCAAWLWLRYLRLPVRPPSR